MKKQPRNHSKNWLLLLLLIVIGIAYWRYNERLEPIDLKSSFIDLPLSPPKQPKHTPSPDKFTIKHMFHHGTGSKNYKTHRRLDITPEWVAKQVTPQFSKRGLDERDQEQVGNDLPEIYAQSDWPRIFQDKNPFEMQLSIKTASKKQTVARIKERHTPGFIESYLDYALSVKGSPLKLNAIDLQWEDHDIAVPDMKDRDTFISLATISLNAYVRYPQDQKEKEESDWRDVDGVIPDEGSEGIEFGWDDVGLRGHVFVSEDGNTIIIGIKGTLGATLPGGGSEDTATQDKVNDNLLFSCCCARVGYLWTTVCDCYEKTYTCNQDCLERELMRKDRYYQAVLDIYNNVTAIYNPEEKNIWVTGHSLGGSLASLLGRTYGLPVVAIEAPGEMLASKRLHLPQAPGIPRYMEHIWHIGNTADPLYMGVCNGALSSCNVAGYAMETACHTGLQCVYDVVGEKGWRVNLLNHRIHTVIDDIIMQYNETAECVQQPPCRDCFNWRYTSHDDKEKDEPVLPNPLRSDKSSSSKESSLSESSITSTLSKKSSSSITKTTTTTKDPASPTSTTSTSTAPAQKCLRRSWYGWCLEWGNPDDE